MIAHCCFSLMIFFPTSRMLAPGGLASGFVAALDNLMTGRSQLRFYTRILNRFGCVIPCLATMQQMLAEDGDIEGAVCTWAPLPPEAVTPNMPFTQFVL